MDSQTTIDQNRYRRILQFFSGMIAHVIWWDLMMRRVPVVRQRSLATRPQRYREIAREFRGLAIEMGGVMIKLGQFLSSRVDVLPIEVTEELRGLQDEVPPADTRQVMGLLYEQLGDIERRFESIDPEPLAAASLGQVYRARLLPGQGESGPGERVVIKVQRPHIEDMVRTDLAALRVVARWLMRYKPIRKRANVPALMEEFARTLWEELNYRAEADNAEEFARIHADNPRIYIPKVYREHSTERVVVLEDVEALKIGDTAALTEAGIDPQEVAELLLEAYFRQVFVAEFFHADPHPGNLFVRPDPEPWASPAFTDQNEAASQARTFQLIFVDFGMAVRVPKSMGENLRKVLIGVTQRDAHRLTEAYRDLGFFLPGADLERITEAQEVILNQIWGRNLLDLAQPDPREIEAIGREFRDLLYDLPFQIPQDFIYLGRALGMISGLVSQLDPHINPWRQIERYGQQLLRTQSLTHLRERGLAGIVETLRPYLETPLRIQRLLEEAEKGRLRVQLKTDRDVLRQQERLEKRVGQLGWSIVSAAGILSATLVYLEHRRDKRGR
ncbi:MAG: AarF/ABC1/UbiB kinase family protein [Anaerolineae bacterium]|uniref:ABC1 kinase family protein n=1 Tax=Promineifilum sp. TaxID=2664178 RepID=UPI001E09C1B9|nr:AarF/ABC1/UbiB kinase family protein [Anaerolineales bacterium]MCB8934093.1 AarF/ABC1/UbiB kinase family protein [Promineifilum sp.]MCO5180087.1 AarF/UbiB family protein [Promineifilum sp.]MCW5845725.1 AarF/ABC1/UbiB kinase family protein [Anaerolineae bacterium]